MRRGVQILLLSLACLLTPALGHEPAAGAESWCRADPVIAIDGHQASIFVSMRAEGNAQARSYAYVLVEYPHQLSGEVVWIDPNHGYGYGMDADVVPAGNLTYDSSGINVRVSVMVSSGQKNEPVFVEWAPGPAGSGTTASIVGTTNTWIVLPAFLPTA